MRDLRNPDAPVLVNPDEHAKLIALVSRGQTGTMVLRELEPELLAIEKQAAIRLKQLAMEGQKEVGFYLSEIARMQVAEELRDSLAKRITQGAQAAQKALKTP